MNCKLFDPGILRLYHPKRFPHAAFCQFARNGQQGVGRMIFAKVYHLRQIFLGHGLRRLDRGGAVIGHEMMRQQPEPPPLNWSTTMFRKRRTRNGNVRELKNLIERSVILGEFPEEFAGSGAVTGVQAIENLELVTQRHIMHVLDACDGNRAEAARRLGVSRKTIDRKMALWDA